MGLREKFFMNKVLLKLIHCGFVLLSFRERTEPTPLLSDGDIDDLYTEKKDGEGRRGRRGWGA